MKDPKALIEHSNNMQNVYKNIEEYNPTRKCNVLIVFDDMIADMISKKKLSSIAAELFVRERKLNTFLTSIIHSYLELPNNVRLNCTHFLLRKFQTNKSFNKSYLIIPQILALTNLWIFTHIVLQNYIIL